MGSFTRFGSSFVLKKIVKRVFALKIILTSSAAKKKEPQIAAARVYNELNDYSCEHMLIVSGRCT